jgi:hypothetical protein
VFLILVARAVAPVWEVTRSTGGVLAIWPKTGLRQPLILPHHGPGVGHMTIKMSGHPVRAENPVTVSEQYVPGGRPRHHRPNESQHDRLLWLSDSSI